MLKDLLRLGELYIALRILWYCLIGLMCLAVIIWPETTAYVIVYGTIAVTVIAVPCAVIWAFRTVINALRQL